MAAGRRRCTPRALFIALDSSHPLQRSPAKYFSGVHRFFVLQFWNFFLTSGAHTRKRTLASLRRIGSLLRGENGSRSECAKWLHKGNAALRVGSKKTFPDGALVKASAPFLFLTTDSCLVRMRLAKS